MGFEKRERGRREWWRGGGRERGGVGVVVVLG